MVELTRFFGCCLIARLFPVNMAVEDTTVAQEVVYPVINTFLWLLFSRSPIPRKYGGGRHNSGTGSCLPSN